MENEGYSTSAQLNILSTGLVRANGGLPLSDINADTVMSQISVLRTATCAATEELREEYRSTVRTNAAVHGIYGISLVAVDGIANYFSGGTLSYYAGLSGGIGATMVMDAEKLFNEAGCAYII